MNQGIFLRRRSKVHVPIGTGGATRAQVASAVREIAAFRCVLSESLIEQIGLLSATELKYWLREIVGVLRRETGAWTCPYKTGHQLPVKLMLLPSA